MSEHYHNYYEDDTLLYRHITTEEPNNDPFYMHIHDQCELLYFVCGKASCTVETATYPLLPDSLILMRPMESHRVTIFCKERYERYTINFSADVLDAIDPARKLLAPFFDRPLGEHNLYRAAELSISPALLMKQMQTDGERGDRTAVLAYLPALLGELCKAFREKKNLPAQARTLATEVADYINAHLYEELAVPKLAEQFYVSVSQLNRGFKKATGFSIWEYIVGKRLVAARNLIREGAPATHAYEKCGFNDYSSFYRMYVKRFGVSPKADIPSK